MEAKSRELPSLVLQAFPCLRLMLRRQVNPKRASLFYSKRSALNKDQLDSAVINIASFINPLLRPQPLEGSFLLLLLTTLRDKGSGLASSLAPRF